MTIANVDLGTTFDQWRTITNQLATRARSIDEGNLIRFASNTNAIFVSANAVRGELIYISANVATSANDVSKANLVSAYLANTLNENIIFTLNKTNQAYSQANVALDAGQSAFLSSNGAFAKANDAYSISVTSDSKATSAEAKASASLTKANSANITADVAFGQANLAFARANTANINAKVAFDAGNVIFSASNLAFARANTANITADLAFGQANQAFSRANNANITADSAFNASNVVFARANTANITADSAFGQANQAFSRANTANITADIAFGASNVTHARVNVAFNVANVSFNQANQAFGFANTGHANGSNAVLYPINLSTVQVDNVIVFGATTGRLAKDSGKKLPSGVLVGNNDVQTLSNKTMQGPRDIRIAIGGTTGIFDIDLSQGNYFTKTISGATTFRTTNNVVAGFVSSFVIELTNGGAGTITWPPTTQWAGGTQPILTNPGKDILGFYTHDGGTTWNAIVMGLDVK